MVALWGAVATRSLTMRGLLNREFESLGAFFWGAGATMMVALGPPESEFGMENFRLTNSMRLILLLFGVKRKAPYALASGPSAKYPVGKVPRFLVGSPSGTLIETIARFEFGENTFLLFSTYFLKII